MIPQSFIDSLLARIDIVDVIGQSVPLKKAGVNFMARCPFHQEKTPSFSVNPQRQFYHCFGCGASGNAISFIIQHHGSGFVEAVQMLAEQAGMSVPQDSGAGPATPSGHDAHRPLLEALERVGKFFVKERLRHPRAQAYLAQRGIREDTAESFGLGYAPPGWHNLETALPDIPTAILHDSGMLVSQEAGRHHDRFRDRLMFPIHDRRGRIIGFGGRVLDQGEPKYLNSPETPLFEKGQELYGWPQARQALRQQHEILVVEGYMDVISLSQAGIAETVATLGTAITEHQIKLLFRSAERIVFAFDGDKAGRKAADRAMERVLPLLEEGKQVAFLFFPEGEDPDSFVRQHGADAFRAQMVGATPLSTHVLDHLTAGLTRHQPESQGQFLHRARPLLASLRAPWLAFALKKRMAQWLDVDNEQLEQFLGNLPTEHRPSPKPPNAPLRSRQPPPSLARQLLACLLAQPELAHEAGVPQEDRFATGDDERAVQRIAEHLRHEDVVPPLAALIEHFRHHPDEALLTSVLQREFIALAETPREELVAVYRDGLLRWAQQACQREIQQLSQQGDVEGLRQLLALRKSLDLQLKTRNQGNDSV